MQPRYIHSTNHANFTCFSVKMSVSYSLTTILPLHNVLNLLYHSIKQKAKSVYTETHSVRFGEAIKTIACESSN